MCQEPQVDVWFSSKLDTSFHLGGLFEDLIAVLTDEAIEFEGRRERRDTRQATNTAMSVILANLIRAHQRDPEFCIGIARGAGDYPRGLMNPVDFGYRAMRRVINYLNSSDPPLVTLVEAQTNREEGPRHVTRIQATQTLIDRAEEYILDVSDGSLSITCNASEGGAFSLVSSHLIEQVQLPIIRLRNERKKEIAFDETEQTNTMQQQLQGWNAFSDLHCLDLFLSNEAFLEVVNPRGAEPDDEAVTNDFLQDSTERLSFPDLSFHKSLYRVFNNGSFDQGGRFYGGWWQNIRSRYRRFITINWVPTVELDYSNMMVAMLYAKEGQTLEGDAYTLEGIDPTTYRRLIKHSVFKLINATGRVRAPLHNELPQGWTWRQVQAALAERHAPIAGYFKSGVGLEVQKIDSDIAMTVMMQCQEEDRLVLPVHDSFITYMGHQGRLHDIMLAAYQDHLGANIGIDVDEAFVVQDFPEEFGEPNADIYDYEDYVRELEQRPEYSGYIARKTDFLEHQTDEWKIRFTPG